MHKDYKAIFSKYIGTCIMSRLMMFPGNVTDSTNTHTNTNANIQTNIIVLGSAIWNKCSCQLQTPYKQQMWCYCYGWKSNDYAGVGGIVVQ